MGSLKLYGVPLSQPFRSVAWALLQKRVPFQVAMAVPGMTGKVGARSPDFLARVNPLGAIPAIEEEESGFVVFESPAILTYLAETRGDAFTDMYPSPGDPQARATINAFMSWHHGGTRQLARLVQPFLRPDLGEVDEAASRRAPTTRAPSSRRSPPPGCATAATPPLSAARPRRRLRTCSPTRRSTSCRRSASSPSTTSTPSSPSGAPGWRACRGTPPPTPP